MRRPKGSMSEAPAPEALARENAYLKRRNAQLQDDVTHLGAEVERLRQTLERLQGRASARAAQTNGD